MICYLYDGSFWGLLTALAVALNNFSEENRILVSDDFFPDLFTETIDVITEVNVSEKFLLEFKNYLNEQQMLDIYYIFLANEPRKETLLLQYLYLVKVSKGAIAKNNANNLVLQLNRLSNQVAHEVLRYQGLVRFRKLNEGIFYAPIKPKHNIVELLAPHFVRRFADQPFVIQDIERRTGIYYDLNKCRYLSFLELNEKLLMSSLNLESADEIFAKEEVLYQQLWREYFRKASISERKNLKLQRQHLPKKYRDHLVESFEE